MNSGLKKAKFSLGDRDAVKPQRRINVHYAGSDLEIICGASDIFRADELAQHIHDLITKGAKK